MSKQSEAKEKQGYTMNKVNCGNCAHLLFNMELPTWMKLRNQEEIEKGFDARYGEELKQEKNLRCGIGGFAVNKTGSCRMWARILPEGNDVVIFPKI